MARAAEFTITTECPEYFCDPHSPWQRGPSGDLNALIRDVSLKGTDSAEAAGQQITQMQDLLNIRPRLRSMAREGAAAAAGRRRERHPRLRDRHQQQHRHRQPGWVAVNAVSAGGLRRRPAVQAQNRNHEHARDDHRIRKPSA